jgi:hypothetical protein
MPLVDKNVARLKAVLFQRPGAGPAGPRGARSLSAEFDVNQVRQRIKQDFDGKEVVSVSVPTKGPDGDGWTTVPLEYVGRIGSRDEHAALLPADLGGGRKLDLAGLRQWGVAGKAKVTGPSGTEDVHFQGPGENATVVDVGAVDAYGVGWASPVRLSGYVNGQYRTGDVQPGTKVALTSAELQRGMGYLGFTLEVFAPGLTDRHGSSPADRARAIEQMDLVVESSYLQGGAQPLSFLSTSGPDGNNFQVGFTLIDWRSFPGAAGGAPTPPPGEYPVFIKKGADVLAQLTLLWKG